MQYLRQGMSFIWRAKQLRPAQADPRPCIMIETDKHDRVIINHSPFSIGQLGS
jgi:hypothetical protein